MSDAPTTPDPIEIAMEAEAHDAAPDSPARRVLLKQEKLIGWEIADRRAAFALKLLAGLAALAAAAVAGWVLWDASQARGLVVEAFTTPPDLAAKGLTGEAAAAQVLDRVNVIQSEFSTARPVETLTTSWGSDLKVEIPQTGVSLEALQRLLRRWLGRQTRVSGEIFHTPEGLRLTVRVDGHGAASANGSEADLEGLFRGGAEALLARTDAYRYAFVLAGHGQGAEAKALLENAAASGPRLDRAWAHLGLVGFADNLSEKARHVSEARRAAPDLPVAWSQGLDERAGRWETALQNLKESERRSRLWPDRREGRAFIEFTQLLPAEYVGDYNLALAAWARIEERTDSLGREALLRRARYLAMMHRPTAAEALLPPGVSDAVMTAQLGITPVLPVPRVEIARARGDWAAILRESAGMRTLAAEVVARSHGRDAAAIGQTVDVEAKPVESIALAHLGRLTEAEGLAATMPLDCYPCLVARGQIAELSRDGVRADRWFGEAARQGSSMPVGLIAWGHAKLARGDAAGALALARQAARKGPRDGDAYALWGEALLAQGDIRGAGAKFAQADRLFPDWGRLHLKWGEALAKLGKAGAAKAQWRLAATLDLTALERAELMQVAR
jgi:tetratricopeptide (TPR) repeat protein